MTCDHTRNLNKPCPECALNIPTSLEEALREITQMSEGPYYFEEGPCSECGYPFTEGRCLNCIAKESAMKIPEKILPVPLYLQAMGVGKETADETYVVTLEGNNLLRRWEESCREDVAVETPEGTALVYVPDALLPREHYEWIPDDEGGVWYMGPTWIVKLVQADLDKVKGLLQGFAQ